jgi:hypothetical protein
MQQACDFLNCRTVGGPHGDMLKAAIRGLSTQKENCFEKDTIPRRKFKAQRGLRTEDLGVPMVGDSD